MYYPNYLKNLIIIGYTASKSCKIWIRIEDGNKDKELILRIIQNGNLIQEKNFRINNKNLDNIAVVKVSNLAPDTKYECLVYNKDNNILYGANFGEKTSFKTLNSSTSDSSFAVLSCNQPFNYNIKSIKAFNWWIFKMPAKVNA